MRIIVTFLFMIFFSSLAQAMVTYELTADGLIVIEQDIPSPVEVTASRPSVPLEVASPSSIASSTKAYKTPEASLALDRWEGKQRKAVKRITATYDEKRDQEIAQRVKRSAQRPEHEFEMGYENYDYKYEETVEGEHFMDLQGRFSGFYGVYTWAPPEQNDFIEDTIDFYRMDGRVAWGTPDYDGGGILKNGQKIYFTGTGNEDFVFELRGVVGKDFRWGEQRVSPYMGFGYRRLRDDGSKMVANWMGYSFRPGYDRISHYSYIPIGMDIQRDFADDLSVTLNLEYDHLLYGKQRTNLGGYIVDEDTEEVIGQYNAMNNYQYKGYGLRAGLKVLKSLGKMDFAIEPFLRYWDIEDSALAHVDIEETGNTDIDWVGFGLEPSNVTKEFGVKMGVLF